MAKKRRRKQPRGRNATKPLPSRRQPWLVGLAIVILSAVTLLWAPWRQSDSVPPGVIIAAAQSTPALPFTLPSDAGEQINLADYLGKQPVVLVFYMGDF